jgi:hypothetical protein
MTTPIGNVYPTAMPDLTDVADIQEALRIYHYGAPVGVGEGFYNPTNTEPNNLILDSVAYHLYDLQNQIDNFSTGVLPSAWTDKGVLISASGPASPVKLDVGAPGTVLSVNPGTLTGLEWRSLDVTLNNTVTLANKSLSSAKILSPGIQFLSDSENVFGTTLGILSPTANRVINLPDTSGTIVTTGNLSAITGSFTFIAPFEIEDTTGDTTIFRISDNVNGNIELGRIDGQASTPYIDFHAGAFATDYDVRLVALSGNGTIGQGALKVDGNLVNNVNTALKVGTHTLVPADFNTIVQMNGAFAFQLNTTLSTAQVGTQITLLARTAGVSVVDGSGVNLIATPGKKLRAAGSMATLICLGTNTWVLTGDLTV